MNSSSATDRPIIIRTRGGFVASTSAAQHAHQYEEWKFAPVRVEAGVAYLSGIVAAIPPGNELKEAAFRSAVERAFSRIEALLVAARLGLDDIVELTTFHVFDHAALPLSKARHIEIFRAVKDQFIRAPYPAWTAIGVSELLPDSGVVEIQLRAHRP